MTAQQKLYAKCSSSPPTIISTGPNCITSVKLVLVEIIIFITKVIWMLITEVRKMKGD